MLFQLHLVDKKFFHSKKCNFDIELYNVYFDKPIFNTQSKHFEKYFNDKKNKSNMMSTTTGIHMCEKNFPLSKKTMKKLRYILENENGYFFGENVVKITNVDFKFKSWKYTSILNYHLKNTYIYGIKIYENLIDILDNNTNIICTLWINDNYSGKQLSADFILKYLEFGP